MDFKIVNEWKEQELESCKEAYKAYLAKSKELKEVSEKNKLAFFEARAKATNKEKVNGYYVDEDLKRLHHLKEKSYTEYCFYTYKENSFFNECYGLKDVEEKCKKKIDKHFEKLQAKVVDKIGYILEIANINGNIYRFKGELGECKVEVIMAGGYNVQRLHTRWIIKK
jgi:hypothetical protein